jgi:hypothetical protein
MLEEVAGLIESWYGEVLATTPGGKHFRRTRWEYALGVKIAFGEPNKKGQPSPIPDDMTHMLVIIPGEACAALGDELPDLVTDIARRGFHATRLDAAVDFHQGIGAHLQDAIVQAGRAGEIVRNPTWEDRCKLKGDRLQGRTVYVGTRQSRHMLRCYDKGLEQAPLTSKPAEWIRWEVQCNSEGGAAQAFLMDLVQAKPEDRQRAILAAALGAFDFREQSPYENDRHLRHRDRLPWFRELVDMFGRTVHRAAKKLPTAEGTRRHLVNAVRMLNTLATAAGGNLDQVVQLLGQAARSRAPRRAGSGLDSLLFRLRMEGVLT